MNLTKALTIITFILSLNINAQEVLEDITTPQSVFSQGSFSESITESTGKVGLNTPIGAVTSGTLTFPVALSYSGAQIFKTAKQINKYAPTGVLGVGWGFSVPQIVVDTKETAARDDDTFYYNGTKLICTSRGASVFEFKTETHSLSKITYYYGHEELQQNPANGQWENVFVDDDYWEVIDPNGHTLKFGTNDNSRENVLAWGNWIGDSNQPGSKRHTITWNLYKIEDQWSNYIELTYEKVEQKVRAADPSIYQHTEASYIKEIKSSKGNKIVFNYAEKNSYEYYEPNVSVSEPDAYQERYQKKFLGGIDIYSNNTSSINTSYSLNYVFSDGANLINKKRYLSSMTQVNHSSGQGFALPPTTFEYYLTGTLKGGIKKVTYPAGGSVTYNYEEKNVFNNINQQVNIGTISSGYVWEAAAYTSDNYMLKLQRDAPDHWVHNPEVTSSNLVLAT